MRILVTGAECSGKSTLSKELSEELSIPWFPEYARTFLEENGPHYTQGDILRIAKEHYNLVQSFPPDQALILDTYLLNLKIWTEYKFLEAEPWIDQQLLTMTPFNHVFLLSPDLAWEQDGFRESEGKRNELFELFGRQLTKLNWDYSVISTAGRTRLDTALAMIHG